MIKKDFYHYFFLCRVNVLFVKKKDIKRITVLFLLFPLPTCPLCGCCKLQPLLKVKNDFF